MSQIKHNHPRTNIETTSSTIVVFWTSKDCYKELDRDQNWNVYEMLYVTYYFWGFYGWIINWKCAAKYTSLKLMTLVKNFNIEICPSIWNKFNQDSKHYSQYLHQAITIKCNWFLNRDPFLFEQFWALVTIPTQESIVKEWQQFCGFSNQVCFNLDRKSSQIQQIQFLLTQDDLHVPKWGRSMRAQGLFWG